MEFAKLTQPIASSQRPAPSRTPWTWLTLLKLPAEDFERIITDTTDKGKGVTSAKVLTAAMRWGKEQEPDTTPLPEIESQAEDVEPV